MSFVHWCEHVSYCVWWYTVFSKSRNFLKQMTLYIFKWYSAWSKTFVSPFFLELWNHRFLKKWVITSRIWGNFETIEGWLRFLYTDKFGCFSNSSPTLVTTDASLLESIFKIWSTTSPPFVWWKLTIYSAEFTTNTYNGTYFKERFNRNCFCEVEMSCSYISKMHFVLITANDFKRPAKWIMWEEEITKSNLFSEVKAYKACIQSCHINSMPAWL